MEVAGKDQSSASATAKQSSSASRLLRYPLRSATKPKDEKPPLTDSSNSSAPRRGKPASSVSKSVGVLDLSGKEKSAAAKPPRRMSIQPKSSPSPASRAVGTVTPISEARSKRSMSNQGKSNTPVSATPKSSTGMESKRLFSALYWLSQIKLSESAAKHSISLAFFKLALEAGCEPLQRLRDELKSYVQRHNLVDLGEPVKQLFECYNISQEYEQLQVSETCSHAPEDGTRSSDDDVHSSSSVAGTEKTEPEVLNKDAIESCQVTEPTKETSSRQENATKTRSSTNKTAATPKPKTEVTSQASKKKLEKPVKQEQNKDKAKRQGKKSTRVEGLANASPPESVLPEDKENQDAPQAEEINTGEV